MFFFMFYIFIIKELIMANIYNNNNNDLDLKISKSEYWDFVLSGENDSDTILDGSNLYDDTLISLININDNRCVSGNTICGVDEYMWLNSTNNGLSLVNSGVNNIDNGKILFDKNTISSSQFHDILTGSTFNISDGDMRLMLTAVSGNTNDYVYPFSIIEDLNGNYIKLEGGFYQGFFKSGNDYSILPNIVEDEISFEFIVKPDLISTPQVGTLNYKYPNNKGILFYLGIRSENKFWYDYVKTDLDNYEISKTGQTTPLIGNTLITSDGFDIYNQNTYDISTDNKYLLFNRTSNGQMVSNFNENVDYHITGATKENINYYQYLNRTKTGYTISNIESIPEYYKPYNVMDDVVGNSIAFRIKDDGSIGYRTINKYCTGETNEYIIDEEYSEDNIILNNELTFINIRLIMNDYSECGGDREFKLWFYVNGKLVFISKSLPELIFRELNDTNEKQETIPYNISIGGGSQGLCDMISITTGSTIQYLLPIENYFGGSFIGDIYQFKIYYGKTDYSKIMNNFKYQSDFVFNPGYIAPTIDFSVDAMSITYPETNYKREVGNVGSLLNATILLNNVYYPITGYKLYYYPNGIQKTQLNGTFNISSSGGTIDEYTHNDSIEATSGLTSVKYLIEVMDDYKVTGTEKNKTILFDYMIFYGTTTSEPNNGNDIRLLNGKLFNNETTTFTLETGASNKIFVIAIPDNRILFSVYDQMAFMMDITHLFVENQIDVPDAGGIMTTYKTYTLINAIPYSRNHNFIITLN